MRKSGNHGRFMDEIVFDEDFSELWHFPRQRMRKGHSVLVGQHK